MLEQTVTEQLEALGLWGLGFFWDPVKKQRAEKLVEEYGIEAVAILKDVWQGGAKDLSEFMDGYRFEFDYKQKKGWPTLYITPDGKKQAVKQHMQKIALDDEFNFLYCPFMKTRLHQLMADNAVFAEHALTDMLCYLAQGVDCSEFAFTDKHAQERETYLKRIGILD